jgi:hypothetical protein
MKRNLKISRKTYETVFSFKINGTMAEPIVPTPPPPQPHPPAFPPLDPFPDRPGYPGYPPSPFDPLPPIGDYVGQKPWRQLVYRYGREYGWVSGANYEYVYGLQAIEYFNNWKTENINAGHPVGFSIPGDRITEETVLGYYPEDEPIPGYGIHNKGYIIAMFSPYFFYEIVDLGPVGIDLVNNDYDLNGYPFDSFVFHPNITRNESFGLYFTGDTIYG